MRMSDHQMPVLGKLRSLCSDDSGMALFVVMAAILLVTVVASTAYVLSSQVLDESVRVQRQTSAFQAANSGADVALERIAKNGFSTADFPVEGVAVDGSTYTTNVTPSSNAEYVCQSVGVDPNGNTERITIRFFYLNLWNMNIASGAGDALGGGSVKGTTSVFGPFYVRGGVELGSNSTVERGPFFIKGGDLTLKGSGEIGGQEGPIDLYVTGGVSGKPASINVRSLSNSVPDIVLPAVDADYLAEKLTIAKSESIDNAQGDSESPPANLECQAGNPLTYTTMQPPSSATWTRPKAPGASAYYKVVGPDSQPSAVGAGSSALTIGGTGSWGSWSGDGRYTLTTRDDFTFDDTTNVLTVDGTVFIDGPLFINEAITYRGNGTIVCNGDITITDSWRPDTPGNNNYMDANHAVGLVTPGNIIVIAKSNNLGKNPDEQPDLCGAFFASKDFSMSGNLLIKGSVLAGSISFKHANEHLVTDPNLPTFLPQGMPGAGSYILTKGAWTR